MTEWRYKRAYELLIEWILENKNSFNSELRLEVCDLSDELDDIFGENRKC